MPDRTHVLLATEGTYPYHLGGVTTWCDMLVHKVDSVDFTVFAVAMNPFVQVRVAFPENVRELITVPLWGTQDPSEHKTRTSFAEIFLQKQRTSETGVEESFLPEFMAFLAELTREGGDPEAVGTALVAMHRYFQIYDYRETLKSPVVWEAFCSWLEEAAQAGLWPEPSVFDAVQSLGWIYHFLTVLNTATPRVDVVHSSAAAFCGIVGITSKLEYGTPYLLTEHGVYLREQYLSVGRSPMGRFAKRFLLALVNTVVRANLHFADAIAPVCGFNARWERFLGAEHEKIQVAYNGVSPDVFAPPSKRASRGALRLLSIARSDPNKDLETLLRAMALLRVEFPDATLEILGDATIPEYHDTMVALRDELGLHDAVQFRGHVVNVADAYRDADVLVQSSISEAFPYSIIEAMMSGLPVVATDVGGTAEAVADTGLLVPTRSPYRLAQALGVILRSPQLRAQLGAAARERALSFFTNERAAQTYTDFYSALAHPDRPLTFSPPPQIAASAAAVVRQTPAPMLRQQHLHLQRGYALLDLSQDVGALDQFVRALQCAPNSASGPAILAEIADLESRLGDEERASKHLAGAVMLEQIRGA